MSSTNKTTHYNLSQYVASDKPTYLVDYNADMSAIDSGIYAAKSEADTNTVSIGTLSSLTTTEKTNLVDAINEVDGDLSTLSGTVGQHTTDIATNTSAIGNLASLNTTAKNNLVAAVNEVLSDILDFNLTSFTDYDVTDTTKVSTSGGVINGTVTIARNSKGTICKIYGGVNQTNPTGDLVVTIPNTGLSPTSEITINPAGIGLSNVNGSYKYMRKAWYVVKTNGTLEIHCFAAPDGVNMGVLLYPCLYFMSNFGDTPSPQ